MPVMFLLKYCICKLQKALWIKIRHSCGYKDPYFSFFIPTAVTNQPNSGDYENKIIKHAPYVPASK